MIDIFRLEDFLDDEDIEVIKHQSMQYANLGDFIFVPKKILKNNEKVRFNMKV